MNSYFSQIASAIVIVLFGLINLLLVWGLHRQWWKIRQVKYATLLFPAAGLAAVALWALCVATGFRAGFYFFAFISAFFFVGSFALTLSLPFSGAALTIERLVQWIVRQVRARRATPTPHPDLSPAMAVPVPADPVPTADFSAADLRDRTAPAPAGSINEGHQAPQWEGIERVDRRRRSILTTGAAAIPAFAVGSGAFGLISAGGAVAFPNVEMYFDDLPPDLDGLRILHISDVHLGYYITLDLLEEMLTAAQLQRPDLVLVTGDISDDLPVLPDALRMIAQLRPRYGTYASLGNHEYYRGIRQVLQTFDAGPVPLLVEKGETVRIGRSELFVGAADDPAARDKEFGGKAEFLQRSVEKALDGAPSQAFHLLMSHRPEGFDPAAGLGLHLTVAGHTHAGGQMGWNGRSLVETWLGVGKYMWGYYEKNGGKSKLYTSAGAGHWFPFRLGVPREAPVYVLRRGTGTDRFA